MNEENQNIEETLQEETQENQPEQKETQTEQAPQPQEKQDEAERNFRALREAKEKAENERDEMLRYFRDQQMSQKPQKKQDKQDDDDEDINLSPDDLVEWRHVEKKIKKLENQLKNYEQSTTATTTETRLKYQYPDFDNVVNRKNIERLRNEYPEIADTINDSKNLYSKAVSAYTLIKRFGIYKEDPYTADRERAQKNAAKPRSAASVNPQQGNTALSRANDFANGLTDEVREQLWREMKQSMKNSN